MQGNQRENQALQVLDEIIEVAVALRVLTVLNVHQRSDFGGLQADKPSFSFQ
jgi:hypothetical protein